MAYHRNENGQYDWKLRRLTETGRPVTPPPHDYVQPGSIAGVYWRDCWEGDVLWQGAPNLRTLALFSRISG
jgi:hypothetical protein